MTRETIIPRPVEPLLRQLGQLAVDLGLAAYAVGGCVRDWRMGRRGVVDLDVTVEGDGARFAQAAAERVGGELTVHAQFGTASLRGLPPPVRRIDVASCRKETYSARAAYPRVKPGSLREDLFRRDFTINAMAVALAPPQFGVLVDPFGGAADLKARRLRALHPNSFLDDPSRILRGVRFKRRLGLRWEPKTRRWLDEAMSAGALSWLNAGRLQRELDRMREEPDPVACFRELAELLR